MRCAEVALSAYRNRERKNRQDGTPPPHREFKERSVASRRPPFFKKPSLATLAPWGRLPLRCFSPTLAATFMPPRVLPTLLLVLSLSFSLLPRRPLPDRSPRSLLCLDPRSATTTTTADPLLSRLLSPLGAAPLSSQHILAPRVKKKEKC